MFRGAFNQTRFNRGSFIVYGAFTMDSSLDVVLKPSVILQTGFTLDVNSEWTFKPVRDRLVSFVLDATSSIEIVGNADVTGKFELIAELSASMNAGRNHVDVLSFTGSFAPGDQITIDANTLKATQNGENILHLFAGEPFDLNIGENTLTYTDDKTGRTVRIRITHRDKFM